MSEDRISLPGIRELFPDYKLPLSSSPSSTASSPIQFDRHSPGSYMSRPEVTYSNTSVNPMGQQVLQEYFSGGRISSGGSSPRSKPPVSPDVGILNGMRNALSAPSHAARLPNSERTLQTSSHTKPSLPYSSQSTTTGRPTHSFDVLRSDPSARSLEHIASSTTLRSRNSSALPQSSLVDGTSPVFRVNVSPEGFTQSIAEQGQAVHNNTFSDDVAMHGVSQTSTGGSGFSQFSAGPPTIISFPVTGPSTSQPKGIRTGTRGAYSKEDIDGKQTRRETRGRKHQCSHCSKRFNRPSSLRIHVNTHTGAKPFQCPYPSCGREFNVNSNMRRHFRNHTLARSKARLNIPKDLQAIHEGASVPWSPDEYSEISPISPGTTGSSGEEEIDELYDEDLEDGPALPSSGSSVSAKSLSPPYMVGDPPEHDDKRQYPRLQIPERSFFLQSKSSQSGRTYSPSSPDYAQSFTDSRVSTTLRPAFSRGSSATSLPVVKKEPDI